MDIFGTDIDLNGNEFKHLRPENLLSFPATPDTGQIIMHTGLSSWYGYNGTTWIDLGDVGGGGYSLPTATDIILGGVKIDNTTITIDGGGVISSNHTDLLTSITNPLDSYFGTRLRPTSANDGFYTVSGNNKATGYLANNTGAGNVALAGFRATVGSDPFGNGIYIGIQGPNYYAPWLREVGLITGKNIKIMTGDNTGNIVFSLGNTATNQITEAQQDKVLNLNTDRTIVAPSLTEALISGESTGRVLITREYGEANYSSLEWATSTGTRAGGDLLLEIGDYDASNNGYSIKIDDNNQQIDIGGSEGGIRVQEGYYAYNGGGVIIGDVDSTHGQSRIEVNLDGNGLVKVIGNLEMDGAQFLSEPSIFAANGTDYVVLKTVDITKVAIQLELPNQAGKLQVLTTASVPATNSSAGTHGETRYDASHVYICTATNTWIRASLTSAW
tara:strand:- start:6826 stop:8157 length:1332 start_codon:yes stop_codon:yes gene_type:complete